MNNSVNKALDILDFVSNNKGQPVSIKKISEATNINKSTVCHIIETLVDRGFLVQISKSSGYVLGIYAYNLTRYNSFQSDLVYASEPVLNWIRKETGSNALLANLINGEKFILKYLDVPGNKLNERGLMYKGDLYNSATGRAMLRSLDRKQIKDIVRKYGLPTKQEWDGVNSIEDLFEKLDEIRKDKVVLYKQPVTNYEWEYAIEIIGNKNERFALGIGINEIEKPSEEKITKIKNVLFAAKKEIVKRMNYISKEN